MCSAYRSPLLVLPDFALGSYSNYHTYDTLETIFLVVGGCFFCPVMVDVMMLRIVVALTSVAAADAMLTMFG